MSAFSDDLLEAAERLYRRRKGQKGPLKSAFARRSVSTTYYALFHFILHEAVQRIVGAHNDLRQCRHALTRTFSHAGLKTAFDKVKGTMIDRSVDDLFRLPASAAGPIATPPFVRLMASAYLDARSKREDADYDLSAVFSETDALQLHLRAQLAIDARKAATEPADRDVKHAVAVLLSLKGPLRS